MLTISQTAQATARLLALLRLADRGAGGYLNERQIALDKAVTVAREAAITVENVLMAHGVDISDLRGPITMCAHKAAGTTVPPTRDDCVGLYPVAGFRHYEGPGHRHRMRVGDLVALLRVIGHPHDPFAVFVKWNGRDLGHLPQGRNAVVWRYLATGSPLEASISDIDPAPHGTVQIAVR